MQRFLHPSYGVTTGPVRADAPLRALVVEDDGLASMLIEDVITELGHQVAAVALDLPSAIDAALAASVDFAVLDVHLGGDFSFPAADVLIARSVPFLFVTGYEPQLVTTRYPLAPVVSKPFTEAMLADAIAHLFARPEAAETGGAVALDEPRPAATTPSLAVAQH